MLSYFTVWLIVIQNVKKPLNSYHRKIFFFIIFAPSGGQCESSSLYHMCLLVMHQHGSIKPQAEELPKVISKGVSEITTVTAVQLSGSMGPLQSLNSQGWFHTCQSVWTRDCILIGQIWICRNARQKINVLLLPPILHVLDIIPKKKNIIYKMENVQNLYTLIICLHKWIYDYSTQLAQ